MRLVNTVATFDQKVGCLTRPSSTRNRNESLSLFECGRLGKVETRRRPFFRHRRLQRPVGSERTDRRLPLQRDNPTDSFAGT